jgi:hypothetical protein
MSTTNTNDTEIPYVDAAALAPYWRENTPIWEGDPTKTYTWWCINAHTFRTTAVNAYKIVLERGQLMCQACIDGLPVPPASFTSMGCW